MYCHFLSNRASILFKVSLVYLYILLDLPWTIGGSILHKIWSWQIQISSLLVGHLKLLVLQQVTMKLTRISLSVLSISSILPMNHLLSYMAATKSSDCTCISVSVSRLGSIWPGSGWLSCGSSSSNSFLFEGLHPLIMQWLDHPSHPKRNLPELKQLRQKREVSRFQLVVTNSYNLMNLHCSAHRIQATLIIRSKISRRNKRNLIDDDFSMEKALNSIASWIQAWPLLTAWSANRFTVPPNSPLWLATTDNIILLRYCDVGLSVR